MQLNETKGTAPPLISAVMTIAEMASTFRISRNRVFDEMNAGRLPAKRIGGRVLIARADAEAWFSALSDRGAAS